MATSGTTAFDMDFTEIAEEAWERTGLEMRTGYDLRTARRSMNLMTIEWFRELAVKGHIMAQYRLAEMYYLGESIDKDYIEAYAWSGIVAARGFKPAEEIRDKIEVQLNKIKLQEARTLAREYWLSYGKKIDTQ